jgi:general secretion pathway protein B
MSYILEALRKAEMERELSRVPGISSRQPFAQSVGRHPARPWMVAAAALAIGVGSTWGLTRLNAPVQAQAALPGKASGKAPQPAVPPPESMLQKPAPAKAPVKAEDRVTSTSENAPFIVPVAVVEQDTIAPLQAKEKSPAPPPAVVETSLPGEAVALTEPKNEKTNVPEPVPVQVQAEPAPPSQTDTVLAKIAAEAEQGWPAENVPQKAPSAKPKAVAPGQPEAADSDKTEKLPPLLSTLPYRFQSTMPPIVINAQAYAEDAAARFVIINMKKYREGQSTPEGVMIEQIGKHHLILSYHGQSFRMQR